MYARDDTIIATPIGDVRLTSDGQWLTSVSIGQFGPAKPPVSRLLRSAADQLHAWMSGQQTDFDLPLLPAATPRGQALRAAIAAIGYGETMSYGALARTIGSGARAVGQACARNPFPIIIPCHRVLAAGGALGAYSGGDGPVTKKWLLDHEQHIRR